jgi:hypothetical protein
MLFLKLATFSAFLTAVLAAPSDLEKRDQFAVKICSAQGWGGTCEHIVPKSHGSCGEYLSEINSFNLHISNMTSL